MAADQDDTYVETTRTSWLGRLKNSLAGLVVGPLVIIGCIWGLAWNEGRSLRTAEALHEGQRLVVTVQDAPVDPSFDGRLVRVPGEAKTSEVLADPLFGVEKNALWLRREAEMYQWKEQEKTTSEKNLGGSETTKTTYTYSKVWSSSPISSTDFKRPTGHSNPGSFRVSGERFVASNARLGDFRLSESLLTGLQNEGMVVVPEGQKSPAFADAQALDGGFYFGSDPANPKIGDMRIRFFAVVPQSVTVIAAQIGDAFEPYATSNGYPIELISPGIRSAEALFQDKLEENVLITWLIRGFGLLFLWVGFSAPMQILVVLADVVPFVGSVVGLGTGFVAFILGLVTWTITIAAAWLAYRPLHAAALLGVVGIVGLLLVRRRARRTRAVPAAA